MPRVSERYLAERRRSIIEAARRVFSEKGVQTATMADVALEAGITPGAIYRYFPSKDDLARECLREGADVVAQTWRGELSQADSPLSAFAQLSRQAFEELTAAGYATDTVLMLEDIIAAARSGDPQSLAVARARCEPIIEAIGDVLAAAQEAGELDCALRARPLAEALMAFYYGARVLQLICPGIDVIAQLDQVSRLLGAEPRP